MTAVIEVDGVEKAFGGLRARITSSRTASAARSS
jgi:hypothetical protein